MKLHLQYLEEKLHLDMAQNLILHQVNLKHQHLAHIILKLKSNLKKKRNSDINLENQDQK